MHQSLSNWYVNPGGIISYDETGWKQLRFRVAYLDDSELYLDAVNQLCIKPHFPNAELKKFVHAYDAFWYLENCIQKKCPPDLFITDIHHPGIHGVDLVHRIRKAERIFSSNSPIPIIVLSMCNYTFKNFREGEHFQNRLCKSSSVEVITECISGVLQKMVQCGE